VDGLKRKLTKKLAPNYSNYQLDWEVGELLCQWWRPNFETLQVLFFLLPILLAYLRPNKTRRVVCRVCRVCRVCVCVFVRVCVCACVCLCVRAVWVVSLHPTAHHATQRV
jgi:hypothetical protein